MEQTWIIAGVVILIICIIFSIGYSFYGSSSGQEFTTAGGDSEEVVAGEPAPKPAAPLPVPPAPAPAPVAIVPVSPSSLGRFVKIAQPATGCMNIGDLQVFSKGVNVAKGKLVTMSSGNGHYPGTFLVDEVFNNFAHTGCNEPGWMTVDLGGEHPIDQIVVKNRHDCCTGRLVGARIEIASSSNTVVYTSDFFKSRTGGTTFVDGDGGFATYTMNPPNREVTGS